MFSAALPITPLRNALASLLAGGLAKMGRITGPLVGVALVVLFASALGLASKHAFSVSFWPANGVLAGLMIRRPQLHRFAGWIGAGVGFVAADVMFDRTLTLAALFAATNLFGTWAATTLLLRLDARDLQLRRVHSVSRIFACLVPASFAAAVGGAVLVKVQFGGSALQALLTWPASELVNYLIILPAMLSLSAPNSEATSPVPGPTRVRRRHMWPVAALATSCLVAVVFDGPGSIMFPMPALLLCALTYRTSTTAVLTALLGAGCLNAIGLGLVDIGQDMSIPAMVVSIRIAVAFLVLVPLTVSSAMAVREDLLNKLRVAADHDGLTGLLNRRAFEQQMEGRLSAAPGDGRTYALLWLDVDHFKSINDEHGHLGGDLVLQNFGAIARASCASNDLVGRIGGEEFALLIAVGDAGAAMAVAERLRKSFADHATMWNGVAIRATVSIGACHLVHAPEDLRQLLLRLDEALYRAKRQGRNRIVWSDRISEAEPLPQRLLKIA
jgi:diguanylate cyclase (GGDEF)-like protein